MSCWQKAKLVGPLLLFNILLPTWDVFSDVKLSVKLMRGGKQGCIREEENVQEFKQEVDLCLQNPQEYCQSDSVASYLCQGQENSTRPPCLDCDSFELTLSSQTIRTDDCFNNNNRITEIYNRCLSSTNDYCSDPNTYQGICQEVTRRHYKFAILLLGIDLHM